MSLRFLLLGVLLGPGLVLSQACQLEKLFPDKVAGGAARLTVRNSAILVSRLTAEGGCLAKPEVLQNPIIDGEIGGKGTLTYVANDCVMDFGPLHEVTEGCSGSKTSVGGKVLIAQATQSIEGTLTGNPDKPIIPNGPNAATVTVDAVVDNYEVRFSDKDNGIVLESGSLSFTAKPHLAKSASLGVCAVATPNLTIEDIVLTQANVLIDAGGGAAPFPAEVVTSNYRAQIGPYQGISNSIEGTIQVWDHTLQLPHPDGDVVLDTAYNFEDYSASFACTEDLALPVSYECESLLPQQAQGVSQLTVASFGNILSYADGACFSGVTPTVSGAAGREGGEARYEVSDCVIDLPANTVVSTNCNGVDTVMGGRVRVSGTKVLRGFNSGDPAEPIIPLSRTPATISLSIDVEEFTYVSGEQSLTIGGGTLTGTARPATTFDTSTGVCSFVTPHVEFENVTLTDAPVVLRALGATFALDVARTTLNAQNGRKGQIENQLVGTIEVEGESFNVPVSGEPVLDPNYDAAGFDAGFMCNPTVQLVEEDAACSDAFYSFLGENAARLVIQTVGTVAGLVNADGDCGFDSTFGQLSPDEVIGEVGEQGSMSWSTENCELGSMLLSVYANDCQGATTYMEGIANIDAARTVRGERETAYLLFDSIRPNFREAVEITLENVELTEFASYTVPAGGGEPPGIMKIHNGRLSAFVVPILAERASDPGMFDISTPVARLSDVHLDDAEVTLEAQGKIFRVTLDQVNLSANNGVFEGIGNTISGTLFVNGHQVTMNNATLNPDFSQASMDASYQCTEDIAGLVPPT